jgi:hypothetical protein
MVLLSPFAKAAAEEPRPQPRPSCRAPLLISRPTGSATASVVASTSPPLLPSAVARGTVSGCDDGTVIDLMVVYTEDARVAAGGTASILSRINDSVADTNLAFSNSLINTSVSLVHTEEVAYVETGSTDIDGPRLLDPNDGFLDEVHPLRDQHSADIVALWVNSLETGGRIFERLNPSGGSGFHEMRQDNYNLFTMAHELGHNLGCAHDRANEFFGDNYFSYSYGYHEPGGAWHTIMAVVPPNTPVIPHFSNPNVTFGGLPTGVAIGQSLEADCAATIDLTRHIVANFRVAPVAGLPAVLYVDASAPAGGDGLGWATAFDDLQEALCQAARSQGAVEQIWVAAGTYEPDRGTGLRQMSFRLQDGLAIYGGFAGTETMLSQRDAVAHVTRLSGDLGIPLDASDNSQHVLVAENVDGTAVLDGFTISGGNADVVNNFFVDTGGGMRNEAASPTIVDCSFGSNAATSGAGMGNFAGSAPAVSFCTFSNNAATGAGGAVHNDASDAGFTNCEFTGNSSPFGGAMWNQNSNPTLTLCTFDANLTSGGGSGGAMANEGASAPVLNACDFLGNSADTGGAVYSFACNPTLIGCTFTLNSAVFGGGAVANGGGALAMLTGCTFTTNVAGFGGAVYCFDNSDATITQCTFTGNSADDAGAVYVFNAGPTIRGCTFNQNTAGAAPFGVGGAMANVVGSTTLVSNSTFTGNAAGFAGGAVQNENSPTTFVNCGFFGNDADWSGGGMQNIGSNVTMTGCLFSGNRAVNCCGGGITEFGDSSSVMTSVTLGGNHAGSAGGGIAVDSNNPPTLTSAILWGNDDPFGTTETQQIHHFNGATVVNHCSVQGWTGALGGAANNGSDPLFVDADGADNIIGTADDDPRLAAGSPAIDSADNTAVPADGADLDMDSDLAERSPLDLDGNPRFVDDPSVADTGIADPPAYPAVADRGAYEFQVPAACLSCPGDLDGSEGIDAGDIQSFVDCFIAGPAIGPTCGCADLDAGTTIDAADVALLVAELLSTSACP